MCQISGNSFMDSAILDSAMVSHDPSLVIGGDGLVKGSEIESTLEQWYRLRTGDLITQSYEEWLASYGVNALPTEAHVPELIRFSKNWSYPVNTVEPTTGVASSAVSWAVAERADKDRFFREPGFIFGVTVARPKVYLSGQKGSAAAFMNDALTWLPPITMNALNASLKKLTTGTGPLQGVTTDYWIDIRDLLVYGDQFINFALSATDAGLVALPTTTLSAKRYPANTAAIEALFTTGATLHFCRQDGVCNLNILGRQVDTTPTVNAR
jgi:hypothetical protein